jgi:hypothetical protein
MDLFRTRMRLLLGVVAGALAAVAVSVVLVQRSGGEALPRTTYTPVQFEAHRAFPMDTLEVIERGEGYLGRRLTLHVDRILSQRKNAPSPPETFETGGGSWRYSEGTRTPFVFFGEVGKQYLFVVDNNTQDPDGDGYRWIHEITLGAPIINGRTPTQIDSDKPFFAAIRGKTPEELELLFAATLGGR